MNDGDVFKVSNNRKYMKPNKYLMFYSGLFFLCVLIICFFPKLFTSYSWFGLNFSSTQSANIGGTIGGIMGPFIAIAAAILTFLAFWVQYKANEKLVIDTGIQRFENRFFEMVRMHRDNVIAINMHDSEHRQDMFIRMFFELKFIYHYVKNLTFELNKNLTDEAIFNIAYVLFYSGANPDTTRSENPLMKKIPIYYDVFSVATIKLRIMRNEYKETISRGIGKPELEEGDYKLGSDFSFIECNNETYCFSKSNNLLSLKTPNKENPNMPIYFWLLKEPFTGHTNELGPYFQHLLQTIKYLDGQDSFLFSFTDKERKEGPLFEIPESQYSYFKLLRAQISTYELLLIYYHSLSILGDEWLDPNKKELLKKYKVLKKMPVHYADFYERPNRILVKTDSSPGDMFDEFKLPEKMEIIYRKTNSKLPLP